MKKMINKIKVEGLFYEEAFKESEKHYVNGKLSVLTSNPEDKSLKNVCDLKIIAGQRYGNKPDAKVNPNYKTYKSLMEDNKDKNFLKIGKDAIGMSISGSIGANYFVPKGLEIIRENAIGPMQNDGSFITILNSVPAPKATFDTDIVITNIIPEMTKATDTEPAQETGNLIIKGYIFSFKNVAIEVTYIAKAEDDGAVEFFSNYANELPVFTRVWGDINGFHSTSTKEEKSGFGQSRIISFETTKKEYVIKGCNPEPYTEGLTQEELKAALADREKEIAVAIDRQKQTITTPAPKNSVASEFNGLGGLGFGMNGVL